jgi:glycosyltransferase involved in cell wall biosynthesis
VKLGLIARCDSRGLGYLTRAFYRHMKPDRTLVVDMGELARGFPQNLDWYPGETVVAFDGHHLPEAEVRAWLDGLDVVWSAETYYDWRIIEWAREVGVRTIQMAMPEFFRSDVPRPDAVWNPTTWRMDLLPPDTRVVPVPVEDNVWPLTPAGSGGRLQVVHVAGHRAAGDRNGTLIVLAAARLVRQPMDIWIHCQDASLPRIRPLAPGTSIYLLPGGKDDRRDLYGPGQVMVLPRRYGGLAMPAQEAMAAGLGLVMSNAPPNAETWPCVAVRGGWDGRQPSPSGGVQSFATDPRSLARTLDILARSPETVDDLQKLGTEWAQAHSWTIMAPEYRRLLAEV